MSEMRSRNYNPYIITTPDIIFVARDIALEGCLRAIVLIANNNIYYNFRQYN